MKRKNYLHRNCNSLIKEFNSKPTAKAPKQFIHLANNSMNEDYVK